MKRVHDGDKLSHSKPKKKKSEVHERSKLACDQCRRGKLKCDNHHPCQACRNKRTVCTVSIASRRPGRPRIHETDSRHFEDSMLQNHDVMDVDDVLDDSMTGLHDSTATRSSLCRSIVPSASGLLSQQTERESRMSSLTKPNSALREADLPPLHDEITAAGFDATFSFETGMFLDGFELPNDEFVDLEFNDPLWQLPVVSLPRYPIHNCVLTVFSRASLIGLAI